MIQGLLKDWKSLTERWPWLAPGFDVIEKHLTDVLAKGRHEFDGKQLFVDSHRYATQPVADGIYERHEKYIDIQFLLEGTERVAVRRADGLTVRGEYRTDLDAWFYEQPEGVEPEFFTLSSGEFAVFFPEDAHMPGRVAESGQTDNVKYVVKVRIPDAK